MTRSPPRAPTTRRQSPPRSGEGRDRLAWSVARQLTARIIRDGWPVGARLGTEAQLLGFLGVSREPFREGLRLMELQGIVHTTRGPRGGLYVTAPAPEVIAGLVRAYLELSEITFREVIEARRLIERHAVALAVARSTSAGSHDLAAALAAAQAAMHDRGARSSAYFAVLRSMESIAGDPCLAIFDEALHRITIDFGLHERLPGELWSEYSERGYRSLEALVQALLNGDVGAGQAAIDTLLSRMDDYVNRAQGAEQGLWTTRSFITGAYLSAGKLLSGADKAGLRLAYRITAQIRRQSLAFGSGIGSEQELMARYRVSRAVFREAVRMLEFFGVVAMRRGKAGGLVVARMDASGTVGSALHYLRHAGIEASRMEDLLAALGGDDQRPAGTAGQNRALQLFTEVLQAAVAGDAAQEPP